MKSELDGQLYCKTNGKFSKHLIVNSLTEPEYVERFIGGDSTCPYCKTARRQLDKSTWTWYGSCGRACRAVAISRSKLEAFKDDTYKQEFVDRSAATRSDWSDDYRQELKDTVREKLKPSLDEAKRKRMATCERLYNDPTFSNREKIKAAKAGVTTEEQRAINTKRYTTCEALYGSFNTMKCTTSKFERDCIELLEAAGIIGHTYKALTTQFYIGSPSGYWLYDFADHYLMKIIEFNGDYWHANPAKYQADSIIGRGATRQTAAEKWAKDEAKRAAAEARGYQVMYIWESDFERDPEQVIQEVIAWLQS